MEYKKGRAKTVIITCPDTLSGPAADEMTDLIDQLMEDGSRHFLIDMTLCDFIGPDGLNLILTNNRLIKSAGGSFKIIGLKGLVREAFEAANLLNNLTCFDTIEDAQKE